MSEQRDSTIKLLLVDDEELILSGLSILLNSFEDIKVVGQESSGKRAYHFCKKEDVDVVLMDIRMPESNGIEGTKLIKRDFPDKKVLVLTTFKDTEYISQAMNAGASGYLLKDNNHQDIYEGIKIAHKNKVVLDSRVSQQMLSETKNPIQNPFDPSAYNLSEKEVEMIQHIATGLNNKEISQSIYLSEGTVRNKISLILDKLELRDRTQLAIFAFEKGLMN